MRKYMVLFEKSNAGYNAYVPDLPGCLAFGNTKEETEQLIFEAIIFHDEGITKEHLPVNPSITDSEVIIFN